MKRARKEKGFAKEILSGRKTSNINNIDLNRPDKEEQNTDTDRYKINEQEEENLRLKYFGEKAKTKEEPTISKIPEEKVQPDEAPQENSPKEVLAIENQDAVQARGEISNKKQPAKKQRKTEKNKVAIKKYSIIFIISLLVIIFASVFVLSMGGLFNRNENIDEYIEPVNEKMGKINVLLLGVDKEGLRTDTIIVASFDMDENKVNLLSIPRDTRMYVGSRYQKINAAHAISKSNGKIVGPEGTIEAVTRLTGIPINYYVEFSFKAFRETIDALGGVYFDVPQNMYYKDPTQDLYINLKKGYQLLDGDKAEQLVRFRSYPEGDIKRVRVQQDFIKAVAEQKLNASILGNVSSLYKTLTKNIKTNLKVSDAMKYAQPLMNLNFENITMYELPGDYSGSEYSASYWLVDINETRRLVESVFGYDTTYTTNGKAKANAVYGREVDPERLQALLAGELDEVIETPTPARETTKPSEEDEENSGTSASPSPENTAKDDDEDDEPSSETTKEPQRTGQETSTPVTSPQTTPANGFDNADSKDSDVPQTQEPPRPTVNSSEGVASENEQTAQPETPENDENSGFERPKPN